MGAFKIICLACGSENCTIEQSCDYDYEEELYDGGNDEEYVEEGFHGYTSSAEFD